MQDESAASEAKPTVETGKVELEKKTSQVPETDTEQGPSGSTGEPLKETDRLIVLERVPNLLVSENELASANIPKASDLSDTVEHHVDNPGSQTQECHSPAASGTPGEGDSTPTTSAPAKADETHPEVPVSSITSQEPPSLVVTNDPALVNPTPSPDHGPSTSSTSPPAETIVNKEAPLASDVLPHSTSPDPSTRDNSEKGGPAATQDMGVAALLSPSVNSQSSSPDEKRFSGEKCGSQEVSDGRELPYTLALPFPLVMDLSLALLISTSNSSTSTAEDGAKARNNGDMKPVKDGKRV
jgi:hypothetical protein